MKRALLLSAMCFAALIFLSTGATAAADKVVICHATGSGSYVTLKLPYKAVFGKAGHFNENGTPNAGHEDDYLGPCQPTYTTTTSTTTTSTTTSSSTTSSTTTTSSVPDVSSTSSPSTSTTVVTTSSTAPTTSTSLPPDVSTSTVDTTTSTSISFDTCEDLGSCPSTTLVIDCDDDDGCEPADRQTTTTSTVVTSSTHPPTGSGLTYGMTGVAAALIGLGAAAVGITRRSVSPGV